MTFSLNNFVSPDVLFGTGGTGVLGFIVGRVKSRSHRVAKLEAEVAECRKRDADVVVLKAGMRILVGKVSREHPDSIELQMFTDLMVRRLGPVPETGLDLQKLLEEIDRADDELKRKQYDD